MKRNYLLLTLLAVLAISFSSCRKPYQETLYEEVAANETAYLIPLEQNDKDKQSAFKSVDFLEKKKVAQKRIIIPTRWHQSGRRSYTGKWIRTMKVIKVDRAPVTREWTEAGKGSTGNKKEDIEVESQESIGFGIGISATCMIPEDWTSQFLYYNNGRTLAQVMDNDIRPFIQNQLAKEFGSRLLSKCQEARATVFDSTKVRTEKFCESMGIKMVNFGAAGQFNYIDQAIQTAINEKFASEMKKTTAQNEVLAAQKFAQAKNAIVAQKKLDVDIVIKEALAEAIKTGKLTWPNTLVIGDDMSLMDIYAGKNLDSK